MLQAINKEMQKIVDKISDQYICSTCLNNESIRAVGLTPSCSCEIRGGKLLVPCVMYKSEIVVAKKKKCKKYM